MEQIAGESQLVVKPDRRALSRYGLAAGDVMELVRERTQVAPAPGRSSMATSVTTSMSASTNASARTARTLPICPAGSFGAWVRLVMWPRSASTPPPQVRRDDVQRRVVIQANVRGRDMGSVVTDIRKVIAEKVDLPTGYSIVIGGQFENQQRAQSGWRSWCPRPSA